MMSDARVMRNLTIKFKYWAICSYPSIGQTVENYPSIGQIGVNYPSIGEIPGDREILKNV